MLSVYPRPSLLGLICSKQYDIFQGFYCATEGLSEPTGPCQPGYYCPGRSNLTIPSHGVRIMIPPRKKKNRYYTKILSLLMCFTGNDSNSSPSQYPCPTGNYCPEQSAQPSPCPQGEILSFLMNETFESSLLRTVLIFHFTKSCYLNFIHLKLDHSYIYLI